MSDRVIETKNTSKKTALCLCACVAGLFLMACQHRAQPSGASSGDPVLAANGGNGELGPSAGVSVTAGTQVPGAGSSGHDASPTGAQMSAGLAANGGGASGQAGTRAANGGTSAGNPALSSAGASAAAGTAAAAGTRGGSGASAPPATAPALHAFGNTSTLELAPVLLAAQGIYPGKATVSNGGIANLFGAGAGDVATNAETQALRQSVDHPDLRIIFTVCEGFYRIVARRSAGISTLAELRGKKVATTPGTSSAYYLHKLLGSVNLTESDITLVTLLSPASAQSTLQSRQADAVTIWEPEIQHAVDTLGTDAFEFQDRSIYRELFNLNTTSAKLDNPDSRRAIVAFTKALIVASEQIRNHPEDVWPLVAKTTGYDQALVAKVWSRRTGRRSAGRARGRRALACQRQQSQPAHACPAKHVDRRQCRARRDDVVSLYVGRAVV
jgi:sulfonate transport system substrate-binding protein